MKGKGKKGKDIEEESNSTVNELKKIDLTKECPKYLEIIDRNIDEGIKLEELDALQLEIEALLVSVVYRKRQIEDEMEYLLNWQDKPKERSNKDSNVKRNKFEERPSKRFKENPEISCTSNSSSSSCSSSSSTSSNSKSSLRTKNKFLKSSKFEEPKQGNYSSHNDIPNRFWNYISTYCSPVKADFLKVLEEMVNIYENEPELIKSVKKGNNKLEHISDKSELNTSLIKKESKNKQLDKKKGLSSSNSSESKTKKFKDVKSDNDKCNYGVLTQRLVSCLIEEDFCAENFEDIFEEFSSDSKLNLNNNNDNNETKLFKPISLSNTIHFEKLLRKELEEHGLIEADDLFTLNDLSDNEEDEINQEIIKCQNELRSIMTQNQFQLKKLINLIQIDLKKQQILSKIDQINEEILEISKRLITIKQKKKNSKEAKKEKESAQKILKERISILQQFSNSYSH